ncbi:ArsR/SmtB family transcription factor [Pseudonocardia sp. TRM90224]|uniref:ArsR/SmtB family transcription factor n=1 Tax=Pseudonocardia sp. TRM90224 TaxID=2812678 RepID=UPI001E3C32A3|nr:helix-turn-helix domain-containing protein [Pseudonocardia sp. TRM90224]
MPDETEPRLADLAAVTTLAHPRRRQILERLKLGGPATSAMLARDLDLNTGATSYHLRELAASGLVEDVPERASGRERWWQAARHDLRFPRRSEQSPEMRQAFEEMSRIGFAADLEDFARAYEATAEASDPWSDAFLHSRGSIDVTGEELVQFFEEYIALLKRYQRRPDQRPEGARTVYARFFAHPAPPLD